MTNQKIFLSYSRSDGSAFALKLATDLKSKGFNVWIDQQDIRAGKEWDKEIEKALESCDCLLFIETKNSVASNNVLDEVYYALEQNKKVIPLIFVDSKTPFRLQRLQHIDFTKDYNAGLNLLVNELKDHTSSITQQPQTNPPGNINNLTFFKQHARLLLFISCVTVLAIIAYMLTTKNNNEIPPDKAAVSTNTSNENSTPNLRENLAGNWQLESVQPAAKPYNGYLKIEVLDNGKANIKGYMQFYYPESEATSYLTVFNAFAGRTSCVVENEMKLNAEDVAVGSRTIQIKEEKQADGSTKEDVVLDASANKSIRAAVTLKFVDNNNAVITIKQPLTIELAHKLVLVPFVYTFRFKKSD